MFKKLRELARKYGILAKPMRILEPPRSVTKIDRADKSKISVEQGLKKSQEISRRGVRGK